MVSLHSSAIIFAVILLFQSSAGFSLSSTRTTLKPSLVTNPGGRSRIVLGEADQPQGGDASKKEATKLSLEEKMSNWEASEEEIKAATLGGVVPKRTNSFDVGLYVAFPFMVIGCLLFLAFPLIADKIDVSSVGPPPTS